MHSTGEFAVEAGSGLPARGGAYPQRRHRLPGHQHGGLGGDVVAALRAGLHWRWNGDGRDRLDEICRYALLPAGKLFRPTLLLLSAAAVGGDPESVLPAAIGTEWGHVASLVHDDIIDDDPVRRGKPSVVAEFGRDHAIVTGDALLFALFGALAECRETGIADNRIVATLATVAAAGVDLCRGQLLEAELAGDLDCDVESYLQMVRWKTGALFRAACASGALLGGAPPAWVAALATYGEALGVAFQIRDDLLGYTSRAETTGKAGTSDVRNRRPTLPVLLACATHRATVARAFAADGPDEATRHAMLHDALADSGAVPAAAALAVEYARLAVAALSVLPDTPCLDTLAGFARRAAERES